MTGPVQWADPPPSASITREEREQFRAELQRFPGRWARYPRPFGSDDSARAYASRIRRGLSGFGVGFEAKSGPDDGDSDTYRVYVRYVEPAKK